MNLPTATTAAAPLLSTANCQAALLASRAGAAVFAVAVLALEAWLRVPVQPVLDSYRHTARSRAAAATKKAAAWLRSARS